MTSASDFDERYADTMRRVWDFSQNDQRPAILEWISRFGPAGTVLDIGPGDAYYMDSLRPASCTLVEPNAILRTLAARRSSSLCGQVLVVPSIADLLRQQPSLPYDLVLLIHVLFYMSATEIEAILTPLRARRVVIVHPWPDNSVTVEFEESIGLTACRERVEQKHRLLGEPEACRLVNSHFRLPLGVSDDELAFLVAHPTLQGDFAKARLVLAKEFVRARRVQWSTANCLELPQAQVLETYNL